MTRPSPLSNTSNAALRHWRKIALLSAAVVSTWHAPAQALEMLTQQVDGIGKVLLLQDCTPGPNRPCAPHEKSVHEGDARRIDATLASGAYAEVWLNSGGGDSEEGPKIGRVLRKHRMSVRVAKGHSCASACTVAFLGGVLRTVDVGGAYHVHARSGLLGGVPPDIMRQVLAEPETALAKTYLHYLNENRAFVAERLMYIQTMIGGTPNVANYRLLIEQAQPHHPYLDSQAFARDIVRVRVEGAAVAHTILMEHEKASFDSALASFQPHLEQLGNRANKAHRIMETMFITNIVRSADLPQETLLKLGFITPVLNP